MADDIVVQGCLQEARAILRDAGMCVVSSSELKNRSANKCFVFDTQPSDQKFVLKVLVDQDPTSIKFAELEYNLLHDFYEVTRGRDDIGAPEPVALVPNYSAYIMRFVGGTTLYDFLGIHRADRLHRTAIVDRLLAGLHIFYESVKCRYGDFHPRNIIITPDGRIVFLDPSHWDHGHRDVSSRAQFGPLSVDLGNWVYCVTRWAPRHCLTHPKLPFNLSRLTVEMIRSASQAHCDGVRDKFQGEVHWVASQYIEGLSRESMKRKLLAELALGHAKVLKWRTR